MDGILAVCSRVVGEGELETSKTTKKEKNSVVLFDIIPLCTACLERQLRSRQ